MIKTKIVNVYPVMPITDVNPPIRGISKRITRPVDQIRTCILARATVEEVFPDGSTMLLNLTNYDKDNVPRKDVHNDRKKALEEAEKKKIEDLLAKRKAEEEQKKREAEEAAKKEAEKPVETKNPEDITPTEKPTAPVDKKEEPHTDKIIRNPNIDKFNNKNKSNK